MRKTYRIYTFEKDGSQNEWHLKMKPIHCCKQYQLQTNRQMHNVILPENEESLEVFWLQISQVRIFIKVIVKSQMLLADMVRRWNSRHKVTELRKL